MHTKRGWKTFVSKGILIYSHRATETRLLKKKMGGSIKKETTQEDAGSMKNTEDEKNYKSVL